MAVIIKTTKNPLSMIEPLRRTVEQIRKDVPVTETRTMEEVVSQSVSTPRSTMWVLFSFAALALLLSSIGTYSVVAYTVAQRTREFGIRMALGGSARTILLQILGRSFVIASLGVALGIAIAYPATWSMRALLFQVTPHDWTTFVAMPALLLAIALIAAYVPARRATKIDPMAALRYE
jgi:ABC-type antimicrobial peptide transport system permease subunit